MPYRKIAAAAAVVVAVASTAGFYAYSQPRPKITVDVQSPLPWERGYLGNSPVYNLIFTVGNTGRLAGKITQTRLEVTPRQALTVVDKGPEFSPEEPLFVSSGAKEQNHFNVKLATKDTANVKWRICALEGTAGEICSAEQPWAPKGDFSPATAFPIPAELSANAVAVAPDKVGLGVILVTRNPGAVHRIGPEGRVTQSQRLEGEPTALLVEGDEILVGTRGPDALTRLAAKDLSLSQRALIAFPSAKRGTGGDPVSSTPVSIASGEGRIWVVTRGGASGSGLMHFAPDLSDPKVPPYFDKISFDLRDIHLRSNGNQIWGAEDDSNPANLFRFTPTAVTTFDGHDYDIVSCATDILVRETDLLVPDCKADIQAVAIAGANLQIKTREGRLGGYHFDPNTYSIVNLRSSPFGAGGFVVSAASTPGSSIASSTVTRLEPVKGLAMPLEVKDISIVDLALQSDFFVAILEDHDGRRETLALRYE